MKTPRRLLLTALPQLVAAQHAAVTGPAPPGTIWLNANESPEGPPEAARRAIRRAVGEVGRYGHRPLASIQETLAGFAGCRATEILLGNGSSEVLHCALEAFTGPSRPLITAWPTWEMMTQIAARSGTPVVRVPLLGSDRVADVEKLAAEAAKYRDGALVHLGNPNNPTSSLTNRESLMWLAANLPANVQLIIDEAYIDYVRDPRKASVLGLARETENLIVTRTFSKLYGLAGARIGFACASAELVRQMLQFRENVVSILGARAAEACVRLGEPFVAGRREERIAVRGRFCGWLDSQGAEYIPPKANFVLIRVATPVAEAIPRMFERGVAVGRRFETLDDWMRVTIGTTAQMERVSEALIACRLLKRSP